MNKIYTKTGDGGTTGTYLGRMGKSDQLAVALGTVDELNSWMGVCRAELANPNNQITRNKQITKLDRELRRIQKNLLTIGSGMAGSGVKLASYETTRLEKLIDRLTGDLPKLSNFIYPTGVGGAADLQVARAVARRAEREMVKLNDQLPNSKIQSYKILLKYLNRLSDGLFTMARWVNFKAGGKEEVWKG